MYPVAFLYSLGVNNLPQTYTLEFLHLLLIKNLLWMEWPHPEPKCFRQSLSQLLSTCYSMSLKELQQILAGPPFLRLRMQEHVQRATQCHGLARAIANDSIHNCTQNDRRLLTAHNQTPASATPQPVRQPEPQSAWPVKICKHWLRNEQTL